MNHSREYVELLLTMHNDGSPAKRIWTAFLGKAEIFDRINQKEAKRLARRYRCKTKECFANAQRIALRHDDLTYVEGFACHIIPTEHAWLVNSAGEVIDPTYCLVDGDTMDYFGIRLAVADLIQNQNSFEPTWLMSIERELNHGQT